MPKVSEKARAALDKRQVSTKWPRSSSTHLKLDTDTESTSNKRFQAHPGKPEFKQTKAMYDPPTTNVDSVDDPTTVTEDISDTDSLEIIQKGPENHEEKLG